MQEKSLIKQIKRIPYIFLLLILVLTTLRIIHDLNAIGKTQSLTVEISKLKEKTYRTVELNGNEFITGIEGTLRWKVKNLKEAFLVGFADNNGMLSYYDALYFLLLDVALFFMIYRMNEETIFSDRLSKGLEIVWFCILFYPFTIFIGNYFSSQCIRELTNNQFTGQSKSFGINKFQLIVYLMIFLYPFAKKAINLQKEQDLTI